MHRSWERATKIAIARTMGTGRFVGLRFMQPRTGHNPRRRTLFGVGAAARRENHECLTEYSGIMKIRNACLVAGSMILGDYIGQRIEQGKKDNFDWNMTRTFNMAQAGMFITFPLSFYWNKFLIQKFPFPALPEASLVKALAGRMMAQIASMPIMIGLQFTSITLLNKGTLADVWRKIRDALPGTLLVGMAFWPIVGLFMNLKVSFRHRPVIGSVFGMFFNTFLSLRVHQTYCSTSGA
eukprot:464041_1